LAVATGAFSTVFGCIKRKNAGNGKDMRTLVLTILFFGTSQVISAQSMSHIFPQFADGRLSDGSYYRSTIMILPWFENDSPNCLFSLHGMVANLEGGLSGSNFTINIPAGGYYAGRSTGTQAFQAGYATLTCNTNVFANVLYTSYASNNSKISEATVFSSYDFSEFRLIADQRDGSRLGLAIANNTDSAHSYTIIFSSAGQARTATITIQPGNALARFLDELIAIPAGAVGTLKISATDSSNFSAIGLRFTGGVFTTVPAN
jgi:hypothetical protein